MVERIGKIEIACGILALIACAIFLIVGIESWDTFLASGTTSLITGIVLLEIDGRICILERKTNKCEDFIDDSIIVHDVVTLKSFEYTSDGELITAGTKGVVVGIYNDGLVSVKIFITSKNCYETIKVPQTKLSK